MPTVRLKATLAAVVLALSGAAAAQEAQPLRQETLPRAFTEALDSFAQYPLPSRRAALAGPEGTNSADGCPYPGPGVARRHLVLKDANRNQLISFPLSFLDCLAEDSWGRRGVWAYQATQDGYAALFTLASSVSPEGLPGFDAGLLLSLENDDPRNKNISFELGFISSEELRGKEPSFLGPVGFQLHPFPTMLLGTFSLTSSPSVS